MVRHAKRTTRRVRGWERSRPPRLRSLVLLLAATATQAVAGSDAPAGFDAPSVAERFQGTARAVVQFVDRHGRGDLRFKDEVGARMLARFLDEWDPGRRFLLLADVREFERRQGGLSDALREGELNFAFDLFHRVRTRVEEYTAFAIGALDDVLTLSPAFRDPVVGPESRAWAPDQTALLDRWRGRVSNDVLALVRDGNEPEEVRAMLRDRYGAHREWVKRRDADDIVERVLDAYVAAVDRHGAYLSPRALERLHVRTRGVLAGIGVILRPERGHAVVDRIVHGGPAEKSRALMVGDRIVGIGQKGALRFADVTGWPIEDVVERLRGPAGTVVRLRILPAGIETPTRTITLIRDEVAVETLAAKGRLVGLQESGCGESRIGIVTVPSFYAGREADQGHTGVSGDVRRIVRALRAQGMHAFVLDLRRNRGGSLKQAVRTAGLFIAGGPIVQVRSHRGDVRIRMDPDPGVEWEGALALLVGPATASAAEIVAAAMQDYRRGIVVGERTFGKGSAQGIFSIDESRGEGALRLTTSRWFRVTGETIERRGVDPDVDFVWVASSQRRGAPDVSVPGVRRRIAAVEWEKGALADGVVASLRGRSRERLRADPGFLALREALVEPSRSPAGARASGQPGQGLELESLPAIREETILEETVRIANDLARVWVVGGRDIFGGASGGSGRRGASGDAGASKNLKSSMEWSKNCVVD